VGDHSIEWRPVPAARDLLFGSPPRSAGGADAARIRQRFRPAIRLAPYLKGCGIQAARSGRRYTAAMICKPGRRKRQEVEFRQHHKVILNILAEWSKPPSKRTSNRCIQKVQEKEDPAPGCNSRPINGALLSFSNQPAMPCRLRHLLGYWRAPAVCGAVDGAVHREAAQCLLATSSRSPKLRKASS